MESLTELIQFLDIKQRFDLKAVSLSNILSFTGSPEGVSLLVGSSELVKAILMLTEDNTVTVSTIALKCLINLTTKEEGSIKVYDLSSGNQESTESPDVLSKALNAILDENCENADLWIMVLNNLTLIETLREKILTRLKDGKEIPMLVNAFCKTNFNKKGSTLDLLGTVFLNLTCGHVGREIFCRNNCDLLEKIIPFTCYNDSITRRQSIVGVLKNICLDFLYHDDILKDRDDILFRLLYPLAGPEQFTDEENEKFPIELQYLEDDKKREENTEIRMMLLESLLQLCATKKTREILRSKGAYEILREYHKWESNVGRDKRCILACENVVHILIKKEDEIEVDNIKDVDVPDHLKKQFDEDDETYLADN